MHSATENNSNSTNDGGSFYPANGNKGGFSYTNRRHPSERLGDGRISAQDDGMTSMNFGGQSLNFLLCTCHENTS